MSVTDVRATQRWYREVLGYVPAGGTNTFRGPVLSMIQGLRRVASTCWWLVDAQEDFQLELFQFHRPLARIADPPRRPQDIGYSMIGVHVHDFDAALDRARDHGSSSLTPPVGAPGQRRVCLRDPDGVLVELMEDDPRAPLARPRPRPTAEVALRSVRLSVPDLGVARRVLVDAIGCREVDDLRLHGPEHEQLWGLDAPAHETVLLDAQDVFVELVRYDDPPGEPWPEDYRISDRGLVNMAFAFSGGREYGRAVRRVHAAGAASNGVSLNVGVLGITYVNDPSGFSVEMLTVQPWLARHLGFTPRRTPIVSPFLRPRIARAKAVAR